MLSQNIQLYEYKDLFSANDTVFLSHRTDHFEINNRGGKNFETFLNESLGNRGMSDRNTRLESVMNGRRAENYVREEEENISQPDQSDEKYTERSQLDGNVTRKDVKDDNDNNTPDDEKEKKNDEKDLRSEPAEQQNNVTEKEGTDTKEASSAETQNAEISQVSEKPTPAGEGEASEDTDTQGVKQINAITTVNGLTASSSGTDTTGDTAASQTAQAVVSVQTGKTLDEQAVQATGDTEETGNDLNLLQAPGQQGKNALKNDDAKVVLPAETKAAGDTNSLKEAGSESKQAGQNPVKISDKISDNSSDNKSPVPTTSEQKVLGNTLSANDDDLSALSDLDQAEQNPSDPSPAKTTDKTDHKKNMLFSENGTDKPPVQLKSEQYNGQAFDTKGESNPGTMNFRQQGKAAPESLSTDSETDRQVLKRIMDMQFQQGSTTSKSDTVTRQTLQSLEKEGRFFGFEDPKLLEKEIFNQIQSQLQMKNMPEMKYSELKFQMKPENLGMISMKMVMEDNVLTAKMKVENESVKNVIEENITELKKSLSDQGIKVEKVEVTFKSDNSSSGTSHTFDENRAQRNSGDKESKQYFQNNRSADRDDQNSDSSASKNLFGFQRRTSISANGKLDYLV